MQHIRHWNCQAGQVPLTTWIEGARSLAEPFVPDSVPLVRCVAVWEAGGGSSWEGACNS